MGTDTGHIPVLYEEVLAGLDVRPGGQYIDATVGAGGYARGILERSAPDGRLLGLDADPEAVRFAWDVLEPFGDRVTLQAANFRHVQQCSTDCGFDQVDGVVMDLGLSSRQLADGGRGFAFGQDGPLDMRYDRGSGRTAEELVNRLAEAELADLLWRYGEERHSRRIARAVVAARPVKTTGQLADVVAGAVGRREKIHPATRTFQALRIAVNDELGALSQALPQACAVLGPRGRLAVVAFHSLEDRIVKRFMQMEASDCICPPEAPVCVCGHRARLRIVTRRPIRPTEGESERNPRSRSARLRVAERVAERVGGEGGPSYARNVREQC
jgi:16S rRNA (cytosine1402-N4)-methyltransferase